MSTNDEVEEVVKKMLKTAVCFQENGTRSDSTLQYEKLRNLKFCLR